MKGQGEEGGGGGGQNGGKQGVDCFELGLLNVKG